MPWSVIKNSFRSSISVTIIQFHKPIIVRTDGRDDGREGSWSHSFPFESHLWIPYIRVSARKTIPNNSYRWAISMTHGEIDGVVIGKHSLVSRVMKGIYNQRPPQPRYSSTWAKGNNMSPTKFVSWMNWLCGCNVIYYRRSKTYVRNII